MRFFLLYVSRAVPGGGQKQMRILAQNLRRVGHESYLVRDAEVFDDAKFYDIADPAPELSSMTARRSLREDDVLLIPEFNAAEHLARTQDWGGRRAVYAQGGFLALLYRPRGGYTRHGIEFMIGVSPYIAALGYHYLGLRPERVFYVPYAVARGPFANPLPSRRSQEIVVSYMPRKLPEHVRRVRSRLSGDASEARWLEIDGVPEDKVVSRLDESTIFFSTQNGEGFGLPAVEAMARGCIVTGYGGTGGFPHPYATPHNGLWAPDRAIGAAARQLQRAVALAREAGPGLQHLRAEARRTILAYTQDTATAALAVVARTVSNANYDGNPVARYGLGLRGHLQAVRTLLHAARIRRSWR